MQKESVHKEGLITSILNGNIFHKDNHHEEEEEVKNIVTEQIEEKKEQFKPLKATIKRSQTTKEVMPKPLHSILVNRHEISPHIDDTGEEVGIKHDYDTTLFHANKIK